MALSDKACRNARAEERPYKLTDGGGLHLLVRPTGRRYWRMAYRFGGKQRTLDLGEFPRISLKIARHARDEAKDRLRAGQDPALVRATESAQQAGAEALFESVADEYLAKIAREDKAAITLAKNEWLLKRLAGPALGKRPIAEIEAPELLAVLREIEAEGKYETANRLRGACGRVFRYAIATGRAKRDVAADLRGALVSPTVNHHPAITDPEQLASLLQVVEDYQGFPAARAALRLAPMVFVRPYELRSAEWAEINLDAAEWRIPAGKMKMRRPHIVPLPQQAVALIEELQPLFGSGRYVFPSVRSADRCMSENTLNAALRRLGYTKDEVCGHGFRTTASTLLHEQGWPSDWVEMQLAHEDRNTVRGTYNAAQYLPDRRRMMQHWADYLESLRLIG